MSRYRYAQRLLESLQADIQGLLTGAIQVAGEQAHHESQADWAEAFKVAAGPHALQTEAQTTGSDSNRRAQLLALLQAGLESQEALDFLTDALQGFRPSAAPSASVQSPQRVRSHPSASPSQKTAGSQHLSECRQNQGSQSSSSSFEVGLLASGHFGEGGNDPILPLVEQAVRNAWEAKDWDRFLAMSDQYTKLKSSLASSRPVADPHRTVEAGGVSHRERHQSSTPSPGTGSLPMPSTGEGGDAQ